MNNDHLEALSALVDGESVDTGVLLDALSEERCSEVLRDFVRLRAEFEADQSRPSEEFYEKRLPGGHSSWKLKAPQLLALAASAGWICFGVLFWADRREGSEGATAGAGRAELPVASEVLAFVPGEDWEGDAWRAAAVAPRSNEP